MPATKKTVYEFNDLLDGFSDELAILANVFSATQAPGISRYTTDFFIPYLLVSQIFTRVEGLRLLEGSSVDSVAAYLQLLQNYLDLMDRSIKGTAHMMTAYAELEMMA